MAPVPSSGDFPGIPMVELDARAVENVTPVAASPATDLNTFAVRSDPKSTSASTKHPSGAGTINPNSINMQGIFALFAIIGAVFVLGSIWFFFWAKNGSFVWRKGDWDEYKSTVLRRKGPDGRTLSNATKSTKLGGGSVVGKGYSDDGYTYSGYTETATTLTEEKPKRKNKFRQTAKEKLLRRHKDERWEGEGDHDVRAYREEKPARIGGMNREADGTYHGSDYDSSAVPTHSEMSEARYEPRRGQRDRNTSGFSFTAGNEEVLSQTTEQQPLRDPSARRQNRRRDRRSQVDPPSAPSSRTSSPRKRDRRSMPGKFTEPLDLSSAGSRSEYQYSNVDTEDSGTRSYHHPIPGLTKGYRRDGRSRRRDSLSDSEGDETRYS
ncbi:hypothetical protein N7474_003522 [Penicillium riverlandense]|uniref:uncharacterized protein n=1 Tax=Penicillium riverlandense TaxID=1903569 RepID=UPI0025491273|nr:uncharacterized protein N7474_003522 [Penicillium riverlandense]KAJ5826384.1 hypothetical protein N7474_003522 [Penicillium riverlandense]